MATTVNMRQKDKDALKAAGDAWVKAKKSGDEAGMKSAHAQAEAIRANYGYSGGSDGSKYIPTTKSTNKNTSQSSNKYTPKDTSGTDYSTVVNMSAADKAALQAAGNAYNSAKTQAEKDAAHAQAESIRAKYGYSGGSDGSQFIQIGTTEVPEIVSTSYDRALQALLAANKKAPTYANSYEGQLNDIYNQIVNRDKFQYDINADMLYQQYAQQYQDLGRLAMQDTIGQAAALTGGYGSSYGESVGQQQYDAYLKQLNEVVPELYNQAYQMYQDEGDQLLQQYTMLGDMADREYQKYSDEYDRWFANMNATLSQYNNDRNFDYQKYQDEMAFNYNKEQADREYQLALDKFAYQKEQSGTSKRQTATQKTVTTQKPEEEAVYVKGSGYDNGNVDVNGIKKLQRLLGVDDDGKWGPATQAAAQAKWGTTDADVAWKKFGDRYSSSTYDRDEHNSFVEENGGSLYEATLATLKAMKKAGKTNAEAMNMLQELHGKSYLSQSEYISLYNKYRNGEL